MAGRFRWTNIVRPLLSVPLLECDDICIQRILKFIDISSKHFAELKEGDKHEAFYTSFAALSINLLITNIHKVAASVDLEPTVRCLLELLLNRCRVALSSNALLNSSLAVGLIRSLCTAEEPSTSELTSYSSSLRAADLPSSISQSTDSDADGGEKDPDEVNMDFILGLSSYTLVSELGSDRDDTEKLKRQQLADLASRIFEQTLDGRSTLWDYVQSLDHLQRYSTLVDGLVANGDMSKPTPDDMAAFKSNAAALINQLSIVGKVLTIPAMYSASNEAMLKKLVNTTLSSLYAGSHAILCSAQGHNADSHNALSVTRKAIEILNGVSKGVRQSSRISTYVHTNIHTMAGWLIFTTLDTLSNIHIDGDRNAGGNTSAKQQQQPADAEGTTNWGMAAHCYALEGLSALLYITKDSSPGQVPSKPPSRSSSARLHEAQRFSVSQFNVLQEYTYLDLVKFICSGSSLRLSGILFTTINSLMTKYTSQLAKNKKLADAALADGAAKEVDEAEKPSADATAATTAAVTTTTAAAATSAQAPLLTMVSSGDDDSIDSLNGIFSNMFSDDELNQEGLMDSAVSEWPKEGATPTYDDSTLVTIWVDVATSYVTFIDKYVVSSAVLKDYLHGELCHTRSQQSLSLLAVMVKSTSEHLSDPQYHRFCISVRRLCRHLIQRRILDHPAQENLLLMVDLFPDNLIGWPIYAHRNVLSLLMDIMMQWQTSVKWQEEQVIVVDMWKHFLDSILSECITADEDGSEIEDVNVEHCQVMLALLYSLSDSGKKQVFSYLAKTLIAAVDIPSSQLVTMIPLPITRLCLLLEYMIQHLSKAPSELGEQVKVNILSEERKPLSFVPEGNLEHVYRKHSKAADDEDGTKAQQPIFYALSPPNASDGEKGRSIDSLAKAVLMSGEEEDLELSDFYKHCLNAMMAGSSLDKVKKRGNMTSLDSCAVHYHIKVVWRLLDLLPPPPAFLLQMTEVSTLGTQIAALQAVRLSPRLRNPAYIQWYKEALKGTLEPAEIDGLVDSVVSRTKSPWFEVQITLHILQAQMATLKFASQGEVIQAEHLPGFHTIVILDAVLSQTHALIDMHYQELREASTGSDYDEAKQMVFKRAVDDLLPALLLMLGSFSEFVRSSMLHQIGDSDKEKTAFATLLTLTSSPDETFNVYTLEPKEMSKVLKEWKADTFWQYPSLGDWKSFQTDNASEEFTNAVILGHCSTLSDFGAHWSTVLPLRHLHMTLIKVTSDLCSWFPTMDAADELCRTLIPLLFDGSVNSKSVSQITSCLSQVIGHSKMKEEKYVYVMARWHSIMSSLHELSNSLSVDTCSQLVQLFSFFMQSCLEEKQTAMWLSELYSAAKADLSEVLLVTGMPGCSDIMSINRVLKVFTKLISLADGKADNPYSTLLRSLNKLSTIKDPVLCQWLQKIIMATPGEQDNNDMESQVDKNAYLLHTIATYMAKSNSLIDRAVPSAILQSLTVVATGVLHQTHNAQGFQELMLIMTTLAKSGEVMSLFGSIIGWLDSCILYLGADADADPAKHSLYVELATCLLSYISEILSAIKAKSTEGSRPLSDDVTSAALSADEEEEEAVDWALSTASADASTALDKQLCTFTETQRDFKQQHWYHCYTCSMTDGVGVCSICVKVCHKDHDVSYAKHGSFFCDCGEKGDKFCHALKKRATTSSSSGNTAAPAQKAPSGSKQAKVSLLRQKVNLASLATYSKEEMLAIVEKDQLLVVITKLLATLQPEYMDRYEKAMPQQAASRARQLLLDLDTKDKICATSDKLMLPQMSSPDGTFDNVKPSFSGDQGTTIKQLINSHMIRRQIICEVTTSGGKDPMLAVANDKGKITILQIASLFKNIDGKARLTLTRSNTPAVPFTILSMCANPIDEDLIAVCGLKECHVLSLSITGAVTKSTILHPALDTGNFIVKAEWLPGEASGLAIVTADFIKIYSLHTDIISPTFYYLLPTGKVRDVTFCLNPTTGLTTILVMSSSGHIYIQTMNDDSKALLGAFYITTTLELNHPDIAMAGRVVLGGGASIYYSHSLRLLMMSFAQGQTFSCSLNAEASALTNLVKVTLAKGKSNGTQPMVQWSESYGHPGLIFCITQSTNNPLTLYVTPESITIQEIKPWSVLKSSASNNKNSKVLDYVAVRCQVSAAKAQTNIMLICEDGSLKIFTANEQVVGLWIQPSLNPCSPFSSSKPAKRKTSSKKAVMSNPQMPVDFFENCTQTNDIEYSGNDLLEVYNKNLIKQRLATANQYVACAKTDTWKIEILNTSTSHVLVGVRVLVGGHLITRQPSFIEMFGKRRPIATDSQRWIDFSFTREESIRGFNKVVIIVGSSCHADHVTFIDCIKVYSKSKDAFGWSEEEAMQVGSQAEQVPTTRRTTPAPQTRAGDEQESEETPDGLDRHDVCRAQAATPLDKLLSDSLRVLSHYFTAAVQPAAADLSLIEDTVSKLVLLQPPSCVDQAVGSLLQALNTDQNVIHERTDTIRVERIDKWMSLSLDDLNPCTYQLTLEWVRQLGHNRPANLSLLSQCFVDASSYEKKLLTDLVERFRCLYGKRPYHKMLAPACFPGLLNIRATVYALVDVIFIFTAEKKELLPTAVSLCLQLLFSKDATVRFACKQAMIKVLKPKPAKQTKVSDGDATDESKARAVKKPVQVSEQPTAETPPHPAQMIQPMAAPAGMFPPHAIDLTEWLGQAPAMIDDLEMAIALSLQEQEEEEDDDEDDEPDDEFDDEDDEGFQLVEPGLNQAEIMEVGEVDEFEDALPADIEGDVLPVQATPMVVDIDSDGGQLSAHSSTEAVQNVGLSIGQRSDSSPLLTSTDIVDAERDTQMRKGLRALVRREMISQGLSQLESCNGVSAIPYLQVMLVLLSDLDSPEDQVALEHCLTVMLDKIVDFKQSWTEFMKRTDRAELEIIVLRLFSVLMSRSHQSDTLSSRTDSRVNVVAASVLIRANCLGFFLPLLEQLLSFWKSYNPEVNGNPQLRFVNAASSTFDMSPFFLRQYVKEHPLDVFEVFPQLQTEMVLRLINQMKKISDSSADLATLTFSDEWTRVLSEYMGVCEAAFIKRQVRKLLNYICGTKENYRRVRDINTITSCMTAVKDAANECGVTENITGAGRTTAIPYTTLTSMVENLKTVQEIASSRCVNWQKYCSSCPGTIELTLLLCVQTTQGLADPLIALLHSAVTSPTPSKSSSGSAAPLSADDLALHKLVISEMLTRVRGELLTEFLRVYLLQMNQTPVRTKMHAMVLSLYQQADVRQKSMLLQILWSLWPQLSHYGKKAAMFVDLIGHMIIQTELPDATKQLFVKGVIDLLSDSNKQLKQHQNTNIYNMLQELVDLDGYYLEREPCMSCNDPEIAYSSLKLNNIKVDNKFTTTTHMIKLTGSHMISRIHIRITDIKKSKMVKSMTINYSNRTVQSAVELKNRIGIWQLAKKVNLSSNQNEVKIDFTVPITACNLMIEYSDFYENNQAVQETLPCPRCSASVPANPGICVNCGENVFQCHKCRSINYDEKDPFLCNTCGFCKYGKFDMSLTARPCSAVDPIESEEDRTKTLSAVNTMLEKADRTYSEIQSTRSTLERLIMQLSGARAVEGSTTSASTSGHVNKFIQQVALKYCEESRKHFEELSKSMQKVLMSRRELLEFDRKLSQQVVTPLADTPSSASISSRTYFTEQLRAEAEQNEEKIANKLKMTQQSSSSCYGCLTATVSHCITLLHALATQPFSTFGDRLIPELVCHNLNSGPMALRHDAMLLLCTLTKDNPESSGLLFNMLYRRITDAMEFCTSAASLAMNIRSELMVISLSVDSDTSLWELRMKVVIRLYSRALQTRKSHVIEAVALSCLGIIKEQIITARPTTPKHAGRDLQEISELTIAGNKPTVNVAEWLQGAQGHSYDDWRSHCRATTLPCPPSGDEMHLAMKYFTRWRKNMKGRSSLLSELNENSWLSNVLFSPASQTSREMCAEIVNKIAEVPQRKRLLAASLSKLLNKVPAAGTNASQFIRLYRDLIIESGTKYYLVVKHDTLMYIASIISREIEELSALEETTLGSDLSQGWGLQALVSIVKSFIDDEMIRRKYKSRLVGTVLDGYLSLRKLVVQRTKMIESTQELLLGLLEQLTTGTEAETREFMAVCIQTVSKYSPTDLRSPVFIFERLCSIIRPEENNTKDFLMILEKDPQQEDFLQGRMSGNPYTSKEPGLGPLMRDVKNRICTDCELVALLEDDSGMELLVNNKIISLDLPVADVYRKVWQPAREHDPMKIVYRMRGLLGDATEDMVNTLQSNDAEEEDSDAVYRMAAVMQQAGLEVMLKRLGYIHNYHKGKQLVSVLLKLFGYCLKLKVNRTELIKPEKDTISVMLRALNRALRAEQQVNQGSATATSAQSQGQSNTEKVLQVMETVLSEASKLPPQEYTEFTKRCGDSDQLTLLLDRINSPFVRSNASVLEALMKLIPFLACGEEEKMNTLLEHFKSYLNFLQFDVKHTDHEVTYLECFCVIASGIKENANGSRLKQMIIDGKIVSEAIEYITILAPAVKTLLATDTEDWKEFVGRPGLPYVLRLLSGLCSGHAPSQEIVGEAMVPILHKLEHMSSHGQIGSLAENLMETLCQNVKVRSQIKEIRAQTKAEKKRLAMAVREKHLTSIGMKTNQKGQVVATSAVMKDAEGLKDESGIICSICREGYHNQPTKVLAVYTYTRRVSIEEAELRTRKVQGLFTVSHMNLVHIDCHASAVRLACGRDEWESAALHNANTRCNGLLPLWGPQVPESNFATALAKHNSYLRDCTELRDDSYTLTVHDVKILLLRLANEQPFSADSGGGGRNSNMLLIPYELLLALYVLNTQRSAKVKEKNLQTFVDSPRSKWVESSFEIDGPIYWLIMCLILWSRDKWNASKTRLLERLLILAQARKTSPMGSSALKDKTLMPYAVYKPVIVLFSLVDAIYNIMLKTVPCDKDWAESLMTYIRNNDVSLAEASEKIVSKYESELLPCESLAEMFDVIGLLSEISDPDSWLTDLLLAS